MTPEELKALEGRVSKGFDVLKAMEDRGDTGPDYKKWFEVWERLLRQYEGEAP